MKNFAVIVSVFLITFTLFSQNERIEGPLIEDFGKTYAVENPEIATDTTGTLKVIFDVAQSSEDKSKVNPYIETAARFLNMHANTGMKLDQLKVAMTIHASAWQDVLTDEAYMEKFNSKNPNTELINALNDAGVDVILCGQTAAHRNMDYQDINPNVKKALSAMTALIQYQNDGYRFIKF